MAKYARFDPRNKKKGRNKKNYLENPGKIKLYEFDDIMKLVSDKNEKVSTRKDRPRV